MSDSYAPVFRDSGGKLQQFGAEETLTWDFTSATGNPMELLVGGSVYFTFDRNGALQLESDITWNTDSSGDVGGQYDYRPDVVNVASTVAVGAVSGVGAGAKLELNRLTIGHGDVDKYIDAEQGLANTPFMRYNAVNTRWEYSNDGITVIAFDAGFGASTWDAIYAVDKTLIIDSTRLTFSQTSTTDVAFAITRNLTAASTDASVALIEQQHASDDQPALVLAQVATNYSALSIYEGTYAGGTERFSFIAEGQFAIVTNSALAAAAVSINQSDDDQPFFLTTGTSAADASKNISTANGATADMIRVEVDGGGGANTRWIPAYTSVTLPGAVTWDDIYLLDKTLDINSTVLTFSQSSSTGRAFQVNRNLASGSTDSPIMVVEQQNAGDNQAPLAIGQLASAADVLQLFDGSVTSGTKRFQFQPLGRLNIVGSASLATEAFRLELGNGTTPFAEFKGTAAAGTGNNISTDSGATADMLQVEVDSGSGPAKRWVPAYTSTVVTAAPTWDSIYAGDKLLVIDGAVLQWQQTSTSGHAFEIFRNLAAASTDSAIVHIQNQNSTDDQPAILVEGGIGAITGGVDVLQVQATSAGMSGGTEVLRGAAVVLTPHGSDAAGAELHGFYVDIPAPTGSGETHGAHFTAALDYGVYSLSPSYFADTVTFDGSPVLNDDVGLLFGTSSDARMEWDTAQTQDALLLGLSGSNSFLLCELADIGVDFGHAVQTNPTLFIQSADATDVTQWLGFTHNQTDGLVTTGKGNLQILPAGITQIGDAGSTGHSLVDNDDLFVSGKLEVDDSAYFDGLTFFYSSNSIIGLDIYGGTSTTNDSVIQGNTTHAQWMFGCGVNEGRQFVVTDAANYASDHDHATTTDPTVFIHSATDPDSNNTEWLSAAHNKTDGVLSTGKGQIQLTPATSVEIVSPANSTSLIVSPGNPTTSTNFVTITATSGGLNTQTLNALKIDLTESALDDTATICGIDIDLTTAASTAPSNYAMCVKPGWQSVLYADSDPLDNNATMYLCNAGTNDSVLLVMSEGTIGGGSNTDRFVMQKNGVTDIAMDDASSGFNITQSNAGGVANILTCNDSAGGVSRLEVEQNGYVSIHTSSTIGSVALSIIQDDTDQGFIEYFGTYASDTTTNLSTFTGGAGAVTGPTEQSTTEAYWSFNGMIRIEVNSSERWIAYYEYHAS